MESSNLPAMRNEATLTVSTGGAGLMKFETDAIAAWQTPKLVDYLKTEKETSQILTLIRKKIEDAARQSGIKQSVENETDRSLIAGDILKVFDRYPRIKVKEIGLIFDLGSAGFLGEFDGYTINARTLRGWIEQYEGQARNQLIAKHIADQLERELKEKQSKAEIPARFYDLLSVEDFINQINKVVLNAFTEDKIKMQISEASIPVMLGIGGDWFKGFEKSGILTDLAPLTNAEKKEIFSNEWSKAVQHSRERGYHWSDEDKKRHAQMTSRELWFRKAVAALVNKFETIEQISDYLETSGTIPENWKKELAGLKAKGGRE